MAALETARNNPDNTEQLRNTYRNIVEKLGQQKKLTPKDAEACLQWLSGSQESHDPKALELRIQHLESGQADKSIQEQFVQYKKELEDRVKKGIVREESAEERLEWFSKLSYEERREILRTKDGKKDDLFSQEREKAVNEFMELLNYFDNFLPLYRRFRNKHLKDRKKMVDELKGKKELLESGVLPTIVRNQLKLQCRDISLSNCKKIVTEAQKKHAELKARFGKLPEPIQREIKNEFKTLLLDGRAKFLTDTEKKIGQYISEYCAKIKGKQMPNEDGFTLFSNVPETVKGSSAAKYVEWFSVKLTLPEMKNYLENSDLDSQKRVDKVTQMSRILKLMSGKDKRRALQEFNKADLDGREQIIAHYQGGGALAAGAAPEKKNWLQRMIRNIATSSESNAAKQKIEAFAVGSEIAERRRRFQLAHHDRQDINVKAATRGQGETLERTAYVEKAVHSDHLRDKETGGVKVKFDTLETYTGDRYALKRALKRDVDNPNAKLAEGFRLVTHQGNTVTDAREFQRGEIRRQLETVEDVIETALEASSKTDGVVINELEIKDALQKTDWRAIGKEVIRKSAE